MLTAERYSVVISCPNGHSQTVQVSGMTREQVEDWAGLLDGTSAMYLYPPTADTPGLVGKCGICHVMLNKCEISEGPVQ